MRMLDQFLNGIGRGYIERQIDFEQCGYKKINDRYDIEVSGLDNNRFKRVECNIYVWKVSPYLKIVETVRVRSLAGAIDSALELEEMYSNK